MVLVARLEKYFAPLSALEIERWLVSLSNECFIHLVLIDDCFNLALDWRSTISSRSHVFFISNQSMSRWSSSRRLPKIASTFKRSRSSVEDAWARIVLTSSDMICTPSIESIGDISDRRLRRLLFSLKRSMDAEFPLRLGESQHLGLHLPGTAGILVPACLWWSFSTHSAS